MSHHGMHIPPPMLGLLPGMNPFEKLDKIKKKQRLKKTATTQQTDDIQEGEDEAYDVTRERARHRPTYEQPNNKAGGKPRQQELSDKVIKSLLEAQEETLIH